MASTFYRHYVDVLSMAHVNGVEWKFWRTGWNVDLVLWDGWMDLIGRYRSLVFVVGSR